GLEAAHPLDVDDVGNVADRGHDVLQLGEVGHFDDEVVDAAAVVGDGDLGLRDVAVLSTDGSGDLGQQAGTVAADVDGDTDRALRRLLDVPLHVDDALPIEHALRDRQAVARVDGQAATARDEAHDVIAGQRVAALREADE